MRGAGLSVASAVFLLLSCNVDIRIACIHPETGCGIVDIGEMRIVSHGDRLMQELFLEGS